jgi:hypothetical protein
MHYQAFYDGKMRIREINDWAWNNRSPYEIEHNTFDCIKVYNSIEECIKSLGSYSQSVLLPDGSEIIPDYINYPRFYDNVFKQVRFPLTETLAKQII